MLEFSNVEITSDLEERLQSDRGSLVRVDSRNKRREIGTRDSL